MFTGIVEATAEILGNDGGRLRIARPEEFSDLKIGASISVSGVCLTLVGMDEGSMDFNVIEETIKRSTIGDKKPGDHVNLERAMGANSRLDGHIVQGHIQGTGVVKETGKRLIVDLPDALAKHVIEKGSIAIDGVSLTVANVDQNLCSVALIPHTAERTTLGSLRIGDRVNIETDVMMRGQSSPSSPRVAIIRSAWYPELVEPMVADAVRILREGGIPEKNISIITAAGSFEIPLLAAAIAEGKKADALIGLGLIIRGETHHADLIATEAARGAMDVQTRYRLPFAFEVLYVDDIALARARTDKGQAAAHTTLQSLSELQRIRN